MEKSVPQSNSRQTLHWFWHFTRPDKKYFWLGTFGAGLGTVLLDILPPLVVSRAFTHIQNVYANEQVVTLAGLKWYIAGYVASVVLGVITWRLQVVAVWMYETRSMQRIMDYVFNHLQRQSSDFHANRFGGSLVSQANKFVGGYERLMDDFTWGITTSLVAFIASFAILLTVSPLYAFVLLLASAAYFTVMLRLTRKQLPYDRALASSESDRTAKLADNVTNVATVRAFAGEELENSLFHQQTSLTKQAYNDLLRQVFKNDTISHIGTGSISILAFVGGLVAISVFNAPIGVLFLTVSYTLTLSRRLWEARRMMRNINRSFGDASDMTQILSLEPEVQDAVNTPPFRAVEGRVQFEQVTFRYLDGNSGNVFENLNLSIQAGEKVGLVGPSGGGKTTITKLILRFMDIQSGAISIDGRNINDMRLADLRASITSVPQEPLLFHRGIIDNIRYGNPDASHADVERVAKLAHAHDFIKDLPQGYDTLVGERGVKLSGGQRQRIAIARAMLKDAPILLLDEATSALDSESEKLIQDALWKLMKDRTAIVIAHRLSTIQHMDRIVVIDKGKIVESGNHRELLKKNGAYARLWAHQSGGFLEE